MTPEFPPPPGTQISWQIVTTEFIAEPGRSAFSIRGRHMMKIVASGLLKAAPEDVYLMRIALFSRGETHPLCDVPFTFGAGRWVWVSPAAADPDEDCPLGRSLREGLAGARR